MPSYLIYHTVIYKTLFPTQQHALQFIQKKLAQELHSW